MSGYLFFFTCFLALVTSEASVQQNSALVSVKSTPVSVEASGTKANSPSVSVKTAGVQVSATTVSTEQKILEEFNTPTKDAPKQPETPNMFKMFKKKTMPVIPVPGANVELEAPTAPAVETESQKSVSTSPHEC